MQDNCWGLNLGCFKLSNTSTYFDRFSRFGVFQVSGASIAGPVSSRTLTKHCRQLHCESSENVIGSQYCRTTPSAPGNFSLIRTILFSCRRIYSSISVTGSPFQDTFFVSSPFWSHIQLG